MFSVSVVVKVGEDVFLFWIFCVILRVIGIIISVVVVLEIYIERRVEVIMKLLISFMGLLLKVCMILSVMCEWRFYFFMVRVMMNLFNNNMMMGLV